MGIFSVTIFSNFSIKKKGKFREKMFLVFFSTTLDSAYNLVAVY
jgi:hypothetical protein